MQPQVIRFSKFVLQVALWRRARPGVVGVTGVEPVTLRLSSACSNQLSYTPTVGSELAAQNAAADLQPQSWWS